jgi:hypothetical protein
VSRYPVICSIGANGERHHRARNWVRHGQSVGESRWAPDNSRYSSRHNSRFDVSAVPDRYPGPHPVPLAPMSDADYRRAVKAGVR